MTDRYACPPIDSIWSQDAKLSRWVAVEAAASAAHGHPLISSGWVEKEWLRERVEELEAEYGHDLAAFVEALREHERSSAALSASTAARWLHYGLCSSDVVDAADLIAIAQVTDVLCGLAREASVTIGALDDGGPAIYRTHGQAARVADSRRRWAGHWRALQLAAHKVAGAVPTLVGFDGPVGTGGEFDWNTRADIRDRLNRQFETRLAIRLTGEGQQAAERSQWITWAQAVARYATVSERFATTVRLLAHDGVNEAREGRSATYRGSSSMPHKNNPTRSERICGLAPVIRALANGYAEAASSSWDAHSLEHSSAERVVFPQLTGLTGYVLTEVAEIARTLGLDRNQMALHAAGLPDSFAERNRLIREGADGGEAWSAVRHQGADADQEPNVCLQCGRQLIGRPRGCAVHGFPADAFDLREQQLRPPHPLDQLVEDMPTATEAATNMTTALRDLGEPDGPDLVEAGYLNDYPSSGYDDPHDLPGTARLEAQLRETPQTIEVSGSVTPNVSADDRERPHGA